MKKKLAVNLLQKHGVWGLKVWGKLICPSKPLLEKKFMFWILSFLCKNYFNTLKSCRNIGYAAVFRKPRVHTRQLADKYYINLIFLYHLDPHFVNTRQLADKYYINLIFLYHLDPHFVNMNTQLPKYRAHINYPLDFYWKHIKWRLKINWFDLHKSKMVSLQFQTPKLLIVLSNVLVYVDFITFELYLAVTC